MLISFIKIFYLLLNSKHVNLTILCLNIGIELLYDYLVLHKLLTNGKSRLGFVEPKKKLVVSLQLVTTLKNHYYNGKYIRHIYIYYP